MSEPLIIAKSGDMELGMLPALANRHGCITGATGTGKTVSLQKLAESFSRIGVPVFMADIKGDLTGISKAGAPTDKLKARLQEHGLPEPEWGACPVTLWDVWGEQGHPVRATVSDMGPLLLARLLGLNETQEGVLAIVFKVADDNGLLLLDLKDLRAMLQHVGENAASFQSEYGNVSAASVGAIQRGLVQEEPNGSRNRIQTPVLLEAAERVDQRRGQEHHVGLLARLEPLLDRADDGKGEGHAMAGGLLEFRRQQFQRLLRRAAAVDAELGGR